MGPNNSKSKMSIEYLKDPGMTLKQALDRMKLPVFIFNTELSPKLLAVHDCCSLIKMWPLLRESECNPGVSLNEVYDWSREIDLEIELSEKSIALIKKFQMPILLYNKHLSDCVIGVADAKSERTALFKIEKDRDENKVYSWALGIQIKYDEL